MFNLPDFYSDKQVGQVYAADVSKAIEMGKKSGWGSSIRDKKRIALLSVDPQIDFVHADGSLSVPGAIDDMKRLINLVYREGHRITSTIMTIDTHHPLMIFFPTWWVDKDGNQPAPFTIISKEDIDKGVWRAVIDPAWSYKYVSQLAKAGKKQLMIWPYHCMDGSLGICIVPPLLEAVMFHSGARYNQPTFVHKGHIPRTEFYSPLCPEVEVPNVPGGTINKPILDILASHDEIWVAGEAKSHCVLEAMNTLVGYFAQSQPEVLGKIFFLMDCTSSVFHPQVDFESIAQTELKKMEKNHGIKLIKSTDLFIS